jgi:hypothetical protein
MQPPRIAKVLRVVRDGPSGAARLYVDGELFPWATTDGYSVHPQRGVMPGVTVTIAGFRVEVEDDTDGAGWKIWRKEPDRDWRILAHGPEEEMRARIGEESGDYAHGSLVLLGPGELPS